jgi:hypothetical protein
MRLARTKSILAATAVATGLIISGGTAKAITPGQTVAPGQTVTSSTSAGAISWRTPAVPSNHARIVNTVDKTGASTVMTLQDSSAPTSYAFPLTLPAETKASLQADGSVTVTGKTGPIGSFKAPWAKDANGKKLPTSYALTEDTSGYILTQNITTTGAVFPVTADPAYVNLNCGSVTCTFYLGKELTRWLQHNIAIGAGIAAVTGIACNLFPSATKYLCQGAIALRYANFANSVNNAARTNSCAAMKWVDLGWLVGNFTQGVNFLRAVTWYWYSVGGSYCPA